MSKRNAHAVAQHPHAGNRGWEVAIGHGLEQICQDATEANAERISACWNACQGIDTEDLKSGSVSIIQKLRDEAAQRVLKQRDELLAALKSLEYANDRRAEIVTSADYIKQMKTNGMSEALEDLDIARRAARAVIAKVEGGA